MSCDGMTCHRRQGGLGPLRLCVLVCAFSTATGCGSLWPFASHNSTDPVDAKVQADKPSPSDKDKSADKDKPADDDKPSKWHFLTPWKWETFHPKAPPGEAETLVLHGDRLEPEKVPEGKKPPTKALADLSGAHELYRLGDYEKAGKIFHRVAEDTSRTPPPVVEEARFYEAECLRRQQRYPRACDTYHKMLLDSSNNGAYKEQAIQRIFDIANYWLEDSRAEIASSKTGKESDKDKKELLPRPAGDKGPTEKEDNPDSKGGKSWTSVFVVGHWEKTKPLFDEEGRALEALEWVRFGDIMGPLADQCLFMSGSIKFYREDYRGADDYFTQLVEMHPNSKYAATALELSIVSKHMSTGGADYDGRKVAEARQMIDRALKSYPTLAHQKKDFLIRQLAACTMQQAEKDYKIAEFYRWTGHPGSAYFYYEIVRRRYPGTPFFDKATERMLTLRGDLEKEQQETPPPREAAPPPRAVTPGVPVEETAPAPRPVPRETAPPPQRLPPNMGQ